MEDNSRRSSGSESGSSDELREENDELRRRTERTGHELCPAVPSIDVTTPGGNTDEGKKVPKVCVIYPSSVCDASTSMDPPLDIIPQDNGEPLADPPAAVPPAMAVRLDAPVGPDAPARPDAPFRSRSHSPIARSASSERNRRRRTDDDDDEDESRVKTLDELEGTMV